MLFFCPAVGFFRPMIGLISFVEFYLLPADLAIWNLLLLKCLLPADLAIWSMLSKSSTSSSSSLNRSVNMQGRKSYINISCSECQSNKWNGRGSERWSSPTHCETAEICNKRKCVSPTLNSFKAVAWHLLTSLRVLCCFLFKIPRGFKVRSFFVRPADHRRVNLVENWKNGNPGVFQRIFHEEKFIQALIRLRIP